MLIRLAYVANYFLERDIAGRSLFKRPDDRFLVAYPGSGGQWLRRLVASFMDLLSPVTAANVALRVPDLYHLSRRGFARINSPRTIFSHESFDAEYASAIYLVRDPRDVAVSIYEQRRQGGSIEKAVSLEEFVARVFTQNDESQVGWAEEFYGTIEANHGFAYRARLKDEFLGTPASWGENVMSWMGARGRTPDAMLTIRYEDLVSDPERELAKVSEYLALEGSSDRIASAVQAARKQTPEPPGKWKTALPESAVQAIESAWGSVMIAFGYAPASAEAAAAVERR